jgi:hypothetical protein
MMAFVFPELTHGVFPRRLAWLGGRTVAAISDPMRHILVLRFALFNLVTFGFLAVAYINGYVSMIVEADRTGLSIVIFTVFMSGLGLCSYKIAEVNRDLNAASDRNPSAGSLVARHAEKLRGKAADGRTLLAGAMRLTLSHRISVVRPYRQQSRAPRPDRHHHRVHHRVVGRRSAKGFSIRIHLADGVYPHSGHVDGTLHHVGRCCFEPVADDQLPNARDRHGSADHILAGTRRGA